MKFNQFIMLTVIKLFNEIELNKIKTAAVPDAPLTLVHPKKIISGDKKIPPPVPVRPESKPIKTPIHTPQKTFVFSFLFNLLFLRKLNISCNPATIKINPTKGL